jgi:hypothetical protein
MAMATSTPWGASQYSKSYGRGIVFYGTAGHGGFHVSKTLMEKIPDYMRATPYSGGGWFEEDCDWAIVALIFPDRFKPEDVESAKKTLASTYPDMYEKFFGVELKPGESHAKDERMFLIEHANDYLGRGAWGDWHKSVPAGMVGVCASKPNSREEKFFLVPEPEYKNFKFAFVIDPSKHKEVSPWV